MAVIGVPITLVSGFLGAGKTTLINEILQKTEIPSDEIAIIVNEFGEVGIDHQLLIQSEEKIYQLNNGCICCNLRSDLAQALMAIIQYFEETGRTLQQVIIETTGIADPAPIIQTLTLSPALVNAFYIDSVLTVVDCINYDFILQQNHEVYQQISYADRFILSKTQDLDEARIHQIIQKLHDINPLADIQYFNLTEGYDPKEFFNLNKFHALVEPQEIQDVHADDCDCSKCHPHDEHCDCHKCHHHEEDCDCHECQHHLHHEEHAHEHHHQHDGFMSMVLSSDTVVDEALFMQWLDWLLMTFNGQLYRYKGLINIKGHDLMIAIQGVNVAYQFDMTAYSTTEYSTQFVLIGKELKPDLIQMSFDELIEMSQMNH